MLTDEKVLEIVKGHVERQFPKSCSCCGRSFSSLAEYLLETTHKGDPVALDAEMDDWEPKDDAGTLSLSNCSCGTTLAIGSQGLGLWTTWRLLYWGRVRSREQGITISRLMADLREKIDARVLQESQGRDRKP